MATWWYEIINKTKFKILLSIIIMLIIILKIKVSLWMRSLKYKTKWDGMLEVNYKVHTNLKINKSI